MLDLLKVGRVKEVEKMVVMVVVGVREAVVVFGH